MITLLLATALAASSPEPEGVNWRDAKVAADAQVSVLDALLDQGDPARVLDLLGEIRASGGTDPRFDVVQARALHATGMHDQAVTLLTRYTKAHGRDPEGWSALGVVQADTGHLAEAAVALERARRLNPRDPTVLNNLGFVRLAQGQAAAAVPLLEASLAQDPSQPRTRNNLGFALARLERDDAAFQAFRAAGSEADARYNLGVACLERGDRASATTQFNLSLAAEPGHPAATAALAELLKEASP